MNISFVGIPNFQDCLAFGAYLSGGSLYLPLQLFELAARCSVKTDNAYRLIDWMAQNPSAFENVIGVDATLAKARVKELKAFVDMHNWVYRPDIQIHGDSK